MAKTTRATTATTHIGAIVSTLQDAGGEDLWVAVHHAAQYSGYTEEHVRRIARTGCIESRPGGVGKPTLFLLRSLLTYKEQQDKQGSRRYCRNVSDRPANTDLPEMLVAPSKHLVTTQSPTGFSLPKVLPSRFVITDQMNIILECAIVTTVVNTMQAIRVEAVREMLSSPDIKDHRIVPFFSASAAGALVAGNLRLNLKFSARSPQISTGDNVIVADIRAGAMKPVVNYFLVRLAI
jgi:hypothetical protein